MVKANSSLRCLAGFNERSATTGFKQCLYIFVCSKESWTMPSRVIQQASVGEEGA